MFFRWLYVIMHYINDKVLMLMKPREDIQNLSEQMRTDQLAHSIFWGGNNVSIFPVKAAQASIERPTG